MRKTTFLFLILFFFLIGCTSLPFMEKDKEFHVSKVVYMEKPVKHDELAVPKNEAVYTIGEMAGMQMHLKNLTVYREDGTRRIELGTKWEIYKNGRTVWENPYKVNNRELRKNEGDVVYWYFFLNTRHPLAGPGDYRVDVHYTDIRAEKTADVTLRFKVIMRRTTWRL